MFICVNWVNVKIKINLRVNVRTGGKAGETIHLRPYCLRGAFFSPPPLFTR